VYSRCDQEVGSNHRQCCCSPCWETFICFFYYLCSNCDHSNCGKCCRKCPKERGALLLRRGGGRKGVYHHPSLPASLKFPFCKPLKKIPPQPCILEWAPSWLYSILQSGCREPDTSQSPPTLISRLTVIRVRIVKEQAPYVLITGGATHCVPECRLYWSESQQQQRKEKMLTSEAERYSLTRYFGCQFHWLDSQLQRQEKMLT
jgi:hypothetical protein